MADDEEVFRLSTAALLRSAGFEAVVVADGAAALARLATEHVSLVISDINMPGNEDLELVRELHTRHPGLPVILLTGFASAESAIQSVNAGVAAYLRKPVRADQLLDAVQRNIGLYETRRVVARSLEHLRSWTTDLARVDEQIRQAHDASQSGIVANYLEVSLGRLAMAFADVREVAEVLARSPGGAAGMRTHELEQAVREAVTVLERTKRDFKSKELSDLRRRLESLVDAEDGEESDRRTA
ncbi:response regulator [Opitutus sp. ER46]|uniref:response regulator n=1 Tax=Opitutus sp. ER46 TaxID=2161864 RepID=UPI00130486F9|nr:response regulator [Opitutus sp. ER46]